MLFNNDVVVHESLLGCSFYCDACLFVLTDSLNNHPLIIKVKYQIILAWKRHS